MEGRRKNIRTDLTSRISQAVRSLKVDEPLNDHTTFHIGGPARYFLEVSNKDELLKILNICSEEKLPYAVIGGGSNILVDDHGFPGAAIKLKGEFSEHSFDGTNLCSGAGVRLPFLIQKCIENGLSGLETLSGIPGTVGGAVMCNAGTSEGWIGDVTAEVELINASGHIYRKNKDEIGFSYRKSGLEGSIVLGAVFNLKKRQKNDILKKISGLMSRRRETQPLDMRSAGSVFKNPEDASAGKLIEEAGLKGVRFGGAQVSEKHANFIVNTGDATASDVKKLISMVHSRVLEKFGIDLELEIKIIG